MARTGLGGHRSRVIGGASHCDRDILLNMEIFLRSSRPPACVGTDDELMSARIMRCEEYSVVSASGQPIVRCLLRRSVTIYIQVCEMRQSGNNSTYFKYFFRFLDIYKYWCYCTKYIFDLPCRAWINSSSSTSSMFIIV